MKQRQFEYITVDVSPQLAAQVESIRELARRRDALRAAGRPTAEADAALAKAQDRAIEAVVMDFLPESCPEEERRAIARRSLERMGRCHA